MIFAVYGASGVGKSELCKRLGIYEIRSHTTREKRSSENGSEYYFMKSKEEFDKVELIEKTEHVGNYYGISVEEIERNKHKDCVVVANTEGIGQLKARYGNEVETVYIVASPEQCLARMRSRGDSELSISKRIRNDYRNGEHNNYHLANHVIYNNDIDTAIKQFKNILKPNLYIDTDGVVFDSVRRFIDIYNYIHNTFYEYEKVQGWNFTPVLNITPNEVEKIFEDQVYYNDKSYIFKDCIEVINRLKEIFNINFLTIGRSYNIKNKMKMFREVFPDINAIGIAKQDVIMNKSVIKMGSRDWLIDDNIGNLITSSAGNKVCFKSEGEKDWNKGWTGLEVKTWLELEEVINESN